MEARRAFGVQPAARGCRCALGDPVLPGPPPCNPPPAVKRVQRGRAHSSTASTPHSMRRSPRGRSKADQALPMQAHLHLHPLGVDQHHLVPADKRARHVLWQGAGRRRSRAVGEAGRAAGEAGLAAFGERGVMFLGQLPRSQTPVPAPGSATATPPGTPPPPGWRTGLGWPAPAPPPRRPARPAAARCGSLAGAGRGAGAWAERLLPLRPAGRTPLRALLRCTPYGPPAPPRPAPPRPEQTSHQRSCAPKPTSATVAAAPAMSSDRPVLSRRSSGTMPSLCGSLRAGGRRGRRRGGRQPHLAGTQARWRRHGIFLGLCPRP